MDLIHEVLSWLIVIASSVSPFYLLFKVLGFRGFEKLTSYVDRRTPYHNLHPLTKILIVFIVTVICAQSIWWVGLAAGLAFLYFYYRLGRLRLILAFTSLQMVSSVLDYSYFVSPYLITKIFGNHLTVIWEFPSYFIYMGFSPYLTLQAVIYSLQVSMRVWAMLLSSGLVLLTTTPSQVIRSLHKMRIPLPITFSVAIALVSLPRIFETADTVIKLQYMKGVGYRKRFKFIYKLRAAFEAMIPLFVYEFKRARAITVAAETRAFMAYGTRTYIDEIPFSRVDKAVSILMISLLIADTYFVVTGVIPAIPFH